MKTNVKNGIIFLDVVATDTVTIEIGDLDLAFTSEADGLYPVFAETNDKGKVERIFIDVNPLDWDIFKNDKITILEPEDIVRKKIDSHK